MSGTLWVVPAGAGDEVLTLEGLGRVCPVSSAWVDERLRAGLLEPLVADLQDEISRLRARLHQAS
jgi:hypothetical protein